MHFLEVLHVKIAQKLQILNFHSFLVIFEWTFDNRYFFSELWKEKSEKVSNESGINTTFHGNMIFGLKMTPEPR